MAEKEIPFELKPCPFCGGEEIEIIKGHDGTTCWVSCGECGAQVDSAAEYNEIIKEWNTRHAQQPKCETCGGSETVVNPTFGPDDPSQLPYLSCPDCQRSVDSIGEVRKFAEIVKLNISNWIPSIFNETGDVRVRSIVKWLIEACGLLNSQQLIIKELKADHADLGEVQQADYSHAVRNCDLANKLLAQIEQLKERKISIIKGLQEENKKLKVNKWLQKQSVSCPFCCRLFKVNWAEERDKEVHNSENMSHKDGNGSSNPLKAEGKE